MDRTAALVHRHSLHHANTHTTPAFALPPRTRSSYQTAGPSDLNAADSFQKYVETPFPSHDGSELHVCLWTPNTNFQQIPPATVFLVHTLFSDKQSLFEVGNRLAAAGLRVVSFDLRGHGRSGGTQGKVKIPSALMDLELLIETYSVPALPNFLYGHGFGATLAIALLIKHGLAQKKSAESAMPLSPRLCPSANRSGSARKMEIHGVLVTSPWFHHVPEQKITSQPRSVQSPSAKGWGLFAAKKGKVIHGIYRFAYSSQLQSPRDQHIINHPKENVRLVNHAQQSLIEAWRLGDMCLHSAQNFSYPLLLIHGDADQYANHAASEEFFENATSCRKELHIWPNIGHEIDRGQEKDEIVSVMTVWIYDQCRQIYQHMELESEDIEFEKEEPPKLHELPPPAKSRPINVPCVKDLLSQESAHLSSSAPALSAPSSLASDSTDSTVSTGNGVSTKAREISYDRRAPAIYEPELEPDDDFERVDVYPYSTDDHWIVGGSLKKPVIEDTSSLSRSYLDSIIATKRRLFYL